MFKNKFEKWIKSASHEELSARYEQERQQWIKNGAGDKTLAMKMINEEINKRVAEEWKNDPRRNPDPNFRWTDANRWD